MKCKACGTHHKGKGKYCIRCNPDNINYQVRWKSLLEKKQHIQRLEHNQQEQRKIWREAAEEVKRLGQLISDKRKELMDDIT